MQELKSTFVHSPLGSIVMEWNKHLSLSELQSHLTSALGIPKQCRKEPLTFEGFHELANIQLIIRGKGASGESDRCFAQGTLLCNDYQGKFFYCSDCCRIFHKCQYRKSHQPGPVLDDRPQQIDQHSDEESIHNDLFDTTDSPSSNDIFQEASKVFVLADTFDHQWSVY